MRLAMFFGLALFAGCATTSAPTFPVAKDSVAPGTAVKRGGVEMKLASGKLAIGDRLDPAGLVGRDMKPAQFAADGVVRLISIVPSVDTKVCEEQTHILGETKVLDPRVERVTISRDLPMAQARFAEAANLTNITYYSDFKAGSFGRSTGLLIPEMGLLARAVLVVDGQGVVRHLQVVPEVANLPDMDKAIEVANRLVQGK